VLKKRHGGHERTIRELRIMPGGIALSKPLDSLRGIFTGNPDFRDPSVGVEDGLE
jgi:circadian clock protein KaiC